MIDNTELLNELVPPENRTYWQPMTYEARDSSMNSLESATISRPSPTIERGLACTFGRVPQGSSVLLGQEPEGS